MLIHFALCETTPSCKEQRQLPRAAPGHGPLLPWHCWGSPLPAPCTMGHPSSPEPGGLALALAAAWGWPGQCTLGAGGLCHPAACPASPPLGLGPRLSLGGPEHRTSDTAINSDGSGDNEDGSAALSRKETKRVVLGARS